MDRGPETLTCQRRASESTLLRWVAELGRRADEGRDAIQDAGQDAAELRFTVADAAERLGITKEAVRKRIARGTLRADKDPDGTVRVYVPPSPTASDVTGRDELVAQLQDEVAHLRRESERKDEIIMTLSLANAEQARTIRVIEAPSSEEPPGADLTTDDEQQGRGPVPDPGRAQEGTQRPWWRRMFGSR